MIVMFVFFEGDFDGYMIVGDIVVFVFVFVCFELLLVYSVIGLVCILVLIYFLEDVWVDFMVEEFYV